MKNENMEIIFNSGSIEYRGQYLNEQNAIIIVEEINKLISLEPDRTFLLDLSQVKKIEVNAAYEIADLAKIEVDTASPYIFDSVYFGLEHLTEELAKIITKWPSYFLHLDHITNLPENVARQFIGTNHALTFDSCSEFSPDTLKVLVKAASFLSLGLSEINMEQAKVLSNFTGDLILNAEYLPPYILNMLKKNSNLLLPPDFGVIKITQKE